MFYDDAGHARVRWHSPSKSFIGHEKRTLEFRVENTGALPLADARSAAHREARTRALELLFTLLVNGGAPPSGARASPMERAELRLTAASAALKLVTRNACAEAELGVQRWRQLANVQLDCDAAVRCNFTRKLAAAVERGDARASLPAFLERARARK